jgi:hypothetical protein
MYLANIEPTFKDSVRSSVLNIEDGFSECSDPDGR